MKKASVVSIGDEILIGQTIDSNASYINSKLLSIGIPVVSCYTAGDDIDSILRSLKRAGSDADVVLTTGGLGPTDDDLTRQAFGRFLGAELQLQSELLEKLKSFFAKRDIQMPEKNKIQAYIPAGARALSNNIGTAPGIITKAEGKLFIAMPGVPSEMKQMFEESVLKELKTFAAEARKAGMTLRKLKCFGAGESTIAELLGSICKRDRNPLINCTAEYGVITLYIIATAKDKDEAEQLAEKDEYLLRNILGKLIFGAEEDALAEVVGEKLTQLKKTIAVAESCTGGCLAKLLTDVSGASKYFTHGWVTYSNSSKTSELGVAAELIGKYGAVSEQVAQAMAKGARNRAGTNFAIGITGVAGPTGGSEQKPVGLVYIGVDSDSGCITKRFIISGDRNSIRLQTAQTALNMLRLRL
jgi:nicotinamide-nucleotide amidase